MLTVRRIEDAVHRLRERDERINAVTVVYEARGCREAIGRWPDLNALVKAAAEDRG